MKERAKKNKLEIKVPERTSELQISDQQLQREITERKQVEEKLHRQNKYLAALHETILGLMNQLELEDLLETIVVRAKSLAGTQYGYLYLVEPEETEITLKIEVGVSRTHLRPRLKPGEGLVGKVWQTGQPIVIENYSTWPERVPDSTHNIYRATSGVPLKSGSQVVGVIGLGYYEEGRTLGDDQIELLTRFAALASIALDNARLYTMVQQELAVRKRAEEKLQRYATELERSNQELQNFASIASHDLQEPLRKIIIFGDRLKTNYAPLLGDQGRDYLQRMQNAARRMQLFIEDLLQYSRVTSQAKPFEPTDLKRVVQEVISDLEARISQCQGRVEVGELPIVKADKLQMRQLFQNLIANALKFHREGEVPIVRIRSQRVREGYWRVEVEDNGIGFEERYLDRIFKPFQRLHGRGEYEGTGMGLAICQKIVLRHGGEITAKSEVGKGSIFIIKLPEKAI